MKHIRERIIEKNSPQLIQVGADEATTQHLEEDNFVTASFSE